MSVIYLDPRAGSGDLITEISPRPQLVQLDSGDVMFTGYGPNGQCLIGIEVKKLGDALACMQDGRLLTQMRKMHEDYEYCFLVVEDEFQPDPNGYLQKRLRKKSPTGKWSSFWVDALYGNRQRILYIDFMRWLFSISLIGQMMVWRTSSRHETGELVSGLHGWFQKEWTDHKSLRMFDTSSRPQFIVPSIPAQVAHVLAGGIGWDKAMKVAEYFGSVSAMINASESDWKQVPGIGDEIARRAVSGATTPHARRERKKYVPTTTKGPGVGAQRNVPPTPGHPYNTKQGNVQGKVPQQKRSRSNTGNGKRRPLDRLK